QIGIALEDKYVVQRIHGEPAYPATKYLTRRRFEIGYPDAPSRVISVRRKEAVGDRTAVGGPSHEPQVSRRFTKRCRFTSTRVEHLDLPRFLKEQAAIAAHVNHVVSRLAHDRLRRTP